MARAKTKTRTGGAKKKAASRGTGGGTVLRVAARKVTARSRTAVKRARPTRAGSAKNNGAEEAPESGASLVVVESPAKAKTIGKYLGRGFRVRATLGHLRDLPQKKLGIDVEKGFKPEYVTIAGKEKTLADLRSAAKDAREVLLATDPDREGEAIAWHVADQIKRRGGARIRRVLFHEITKEAVRHAIDNATEIDPRKVEAQQARRVLDRLVGYKASPVLWKTVKKGLSAGRVQTVALRLIVEREREIRAFKPVEYWSIEALLAHNDQEFTAKLRQVDGKKPEIGNAGTANAIVADLRKHKTFPVVDVKKRERRKNPSAPFITSTLQQEAAKKLGFGSKRTMRVAQDLYEGIELGKEEGAQGLITYMRTDSTRVSEQAALQAREFVKKTFGDAYLAAGGPQLYGSSKGKRTQDAHEAIRPTDPSRRPESIARYLSKDQLAMYQLIWQRFVASQMAPAVFDTTTVDLTVGRYDFRATGSVVKFTGYLALYKETREEGDSRALEDEQALPDVAKGEQVPVRSIVPNQHFTEPPPRFSEASLVKELERLGIGRPSTYAQIISTLVDRRYTLLEQRRFFPTELGETVLKVMVMQFPEIFNVTFTSAMEDELDRVEEGDITWQKALADFWSQFSVSLADVDYEGLIRSAHDLSSLATERCPDCGGKLIPRGGFFGPFLACERHPKECKYTRPVRGEKSKPVMTEEKCHECGAFMVIRQGRSGPFLGCSKFPKCRGTRSLPTGVKCPKDGGDIAQRRSKKRGKAFFGCSNYPNCDFVVWDKPVPETCPDCGYVGAEMKSNKTRGEYRRCVKCANEWDVVQVEEAVVA